MPHKAVPTDRFVHICGIVQEAFRDIDVYGIPVKVENWRKIVENRLSKQGKKYSISYEGFPPQGPFILGALLRYESGAKIFYSNGQPIFVQRLIIAKELGHLLIDGPNDYTLKPSTVMTQLVSGIPIWALRQDSTQDEAAFESERMAMVAAFEMLIPWKFRARLEEFSHKGLSPDEMAVQFRVPTHVISTMISPLYGPLSNNANTTAQKKSGK